MARQKTITTVTLDSVVGIKWSDDQIAAAKRMYDEGMSIREVSEETGISKIALKRRFNDILDKAAKTATQKVVDELKTETKEDHFLTGSRRFAYNIGIEKASEHLKERIIKQVDLLFDVTEKSLKKTMKIIERANTDIPKDYDAVEQLKFLTPVWTAALNASQLLTGKPTAFVAQIGKVEHDIITHRIEEYTDVYRKLAEERGVLSGGNESDNLGEQVDKKPTHYKASALPTST